MSEPRPNILLITVDQMRFDHLGLAGVKGVRTPNLDRLGSEGIHFRRAYTPSPVCTPARVSLLTGQYPSRHGAYSIGVSADPFPSPALPLGLAEAGYDCSLFGKTHFVSRLDENRHLTGRDNTDSAFFRQFDGPYCGFDFVRTCAHHTINGIPEGHYRAWLEDQAVDFAPWFPDETGTHDHSATGAWSIPERYHDSTWITDQAIAHLENNGADQPWFAWLSFNDPHEPFVCPEPWFSRVDREAMELPEDYRAGEFDDKPDFYRTVYESEEPLDGWPEAFRDVSGQIVPCAYNRRDLRGKERKALQATLGMVAMIDHQVGRILDFLESTGQADNTLLVFTSDHGELHGHHGLWHKGLFAYEDVQRVPLLAWGPGILERRGSCDALTNLVDLPRSFLSLAGAPLPQGTQGCDLGLLFKGETDSVREATWVELQATRAVYQQTLITEAHKIVIYRDSDFGELYALQNDPDQYHNLWNDTASASLKARLLLLFVQTRMHEEGQVHLRKSYA